jgi:hypothetical protein
VTTKSKSYGFVSYKDPEDFMQTWKEMNGKYVGSQPIKISGATTKVGVVQIGNKRLDPLMIIGRRNSSKVLNACALELAPFGRTIIGLILVYKASPSSPLRFADNWRRRGGRPSQQ